MKLISFNGKHAHVYCLFVCFLGSIWFLTTCISIKYTKEEFLFRCTSNHTADLNKGCLKTVNVFNCSSLFLCSFLTQHLFIAILSLQSRKYVATCYMAYAFLFLFLYSSVFLLVTSMLDVGSFILLLLLSVRQEKERRMSMYIRNELSQ